MFRLSTLSGSMIDDFLQFAERTKSLKKMFTQVEQDAGKSHFKLTGDESSLLVGSHDILFTTDYYDSQKVLDIESEVDKFVQIFSNINSSIKVREIRRIGIVCEYRNKSRTELPSRELIESITKIPPDGFPAKFQLQFEQRHPISTITGVPDIRTDDFWNVIESFYDGEVDADHSSSKQINVSVDVQRYYKPLLDDKFEGSIRGVKDRFISESKKIFDKPYLLGLLNGD